MSGILKKMLAWLRPLPNRHAGAASSMERAADPVAPSRHGDPPVGWQRGSCTDLASAVASLGYRIDHCAWTWDPRPMPGKARCKAPWGSSGFPGLAATDGAGEPFLEAHLFWDAGNDTILEVAIFAERDNGFRWIWQRHESHSHWHRVPLRDSEAGPQVRVHASGALVLLPHRGQEGL